MFGFPVLFYNFSFEYDLIGYAALCFFVVGFYQESLNCSTRLHLAV